MADLLGSILSSMEKPPSVGNQESRRKARVPVANKRDTRSIEEAMNAIRAKKKQKRSEGECAGSSSSP
ncbi:UNVERIFIED_CONTAM: hypothetical protein FKN15_015963 [Acipenser sinensis]